MTKSPRKNVPDVGIEHGAACMPRGYASDRATVSGLMSDNITFINALYRIAFNQDGNAVFIWSFNVGFIFAEQIDVIFMRPVRLQSRYFMSLHYWSLYSFVISARPRSAEYTIGICFETAKKTKAFECFAGFRHSL